MSAVFNYQGKQVDEEFLWHEFRKTRSDILRDMLVKQYSPLVKYVAGKISMGLPNTVDFDDLLSCGAFGLIDAINRFDPTRQVKFKTYAVTRIRGAIYDELRAVDWVPRSIRQKIRHTENCSIELEDELGRIPRDEEVAERACIDIKEYRELLARVKCNSIISINGGRNNSDDDKDRLTLSDTIKCSNILHPEDIVEKKEVYYKLSSLLKTLPEKEKQVLILYYYEDLTLREIGQILDVTESRISQLHSKAMLRLRAKLTNEVKNYEKTSCK